MDPNHRSSLMDHFLKMMRLTNTPTATPVGEDEGAEVDEPPDDRVPQLNHIFLKDALYHKSSPSAKVDRRESLLTRAILAGSETSPASSRTPYVPRGLSNASSHSFASTAELTSDDNSPARSVSPSPPPPGNRIPLVTVKPSEHPSKIIIAPVTKDDKPDIAQVGEAAIEKTLGRKRCIMFACNSAATNTPVEPSPKVAPAIKIEEEPKPAPRKCRLTFACPTRQDSASDTGLFAQEVTEKSTTRKRSTSPTSQKHQTPVVPVVDEKKLLSPPTVKPNQDVTAPSSGMTSPSPLSPKYAFHEFASSHDETDEWVEKAEEINKPKLTLDDVFRKEFAIRKIGKEAEEEAEAEEREQDELDNEMEDDDNDGEDDFAPSDRDSDGGNESDDEEGFAESDDESEDESEYQFWTHTSSSHVRSTSNEAITHFSARRASRSRVSSISSTHSESEMNQNARPILNNNNNRRPSKLISRMRPGTPELPDSTDFVCGTLDEDRPLEAAYISCREQKRRQKHIPIPQDIDPSFPTTDPEDDDEENDDVANSTDNAWIKGQFEDFDDEARGRRKPSAFKVSPLHSPSPMIAPPRQPIPRSTMIKHGVTRSPPPKQARAKSPAPQRRLFDQAPRRLRSPPPVGKLRSPRGSPTGKLPPLGITINRLAQRPKTDQTSSLPHTPNPFFKNWRNGSPPISTIPSAAVSPGNEDVRSDIHVRGPVDIVIGLEKKRQKRKEKFWRQHCRKAAREQAEKRPPPGRGAERMKELGLECAERTRGYGLGQPAQLVLSL